MTTKCERCEHEIDSEMAPYCVQCWKLKAALERDKYEDGFINDPWKRRSEGMKGSTCMWFVEKVVDAPIARNDRVVGRCRKHAPTMNGYPVVFTTDFCGDHKFDENKV